MHIVVSWHIVFLCFYPATIVVWHVCTIFFFLFNYVPKHASWEAPSDLMDEGMNAVPDDPITGPGVPPGFSWLRWHSLATNRLQRGNDVQPLRNSRKHNRKGRRP